MPVILLRAGCRWIQPAIYFFTTFNLFNAHVISMLPCITGCMSGWLIHCAEMEHLTIQRYICTHLGSLPVTPCRVTRHHWYSPIRCISFWRQCLPSEASGILNENLYMCSLNLVCYLWINTMSCGRGCFIFWTSTYSRYCIVVTYILIWGQKVEHKNSYLVLWKLINSIKNNIIG